jgi:DDE superfamily endonuclease
MNTTKIQPKQEQMPQVPQSPLPELAEFLAPMRVHFTPGPSAETLRQYGSGLLSEQPTKTCDPLAAVRPERSEQQLPYRLTDRVWDEQALNRQRLAQRLRLPRAGEGVLICDETGFETKGRPSAGVARQDTGTGGQLTTGQVTGTCQYAERTRAWPWRRGCICRRGGPRMRCGASAPMSRRTSLFRLKRRSPWRCGMKRAAVG